MSVLEVQKCSTCQAHLPGPSNVCPWCYRRLGRVEAFYSPEVRQKLDAITDRLRDVVERDGWDCWLCGHGVEPFDLGIHRASADHVIPRSQGGSDDLSNLRLAHQSCNGYRSKTKTAPFAPFDREATL